MPELMHGRGSDPSQIAAIVFDGATLVVIQNQGAKTKAPATITRLDLSAISSAPPHSTIGSWG